MITVSPSSSLPQNKQLSSSSSQSPDNNALLSGDWDDDDDNCLFCGRDDDGETVIIKDYKLTATVTVKAINDSEPFKSSLRVNFGGSERKRSIQFFREFFTAIDKSLFLDQSIEDLS